MTEAGLGVVVVVVVHVVAVVRFLELRLLRVNVVRLHVDVQCPLRREAHLTVLVRARELQLRVGQPQVLLECCGVEKAFSGEVIHVTETWVVRICASPGGGTV